MNHNNFSDAKEKTTPFRSANERVGYTQAQVPTIQLLDELVLILGHGLYAQGDQFMYIWVQEQSFCLETWQFEGKWSFSEDVPSDKNLKAEILRFIEEHGRPGQ